MIRTSSIANRLRPRRTWAITLVCLLLISAACASPGPRPATFERETKALAALFPMLERLELQTYRDQDWCRLLVYDRGVYASELDEACTITSDDWRPFDKEADLAFQLLVEAVAKSGADVEMINVTRYAANGSVGEVEFEFLPADAKPGYYRLIFDRTGEMPMDGNETTNTRIGPQWYLQFEDWM